MPLLAALGVFLVALAKLLVVAHGNETTFLALLGHSDTATVAAVAVLVAAPGAAGVCAGAGVVLLGSVSRTDRRRGWGLLGVAAVTAVVLVPAATALIGAAVIGSCAGIAHVLRRRTRWASNEASSSAVGASRWLTMCAGVIAFVLIQDDPWLPAESVTVRGGRPIVGYVVAESPAELLVLLESDRNVVRVERSRATSRRYCTVHGPFESASVAAWVAGASRPYPECDDVE